MKIKYTYLITCQSREMLLSVHLICPNILSQSRKDLSHIRFQIKE